MYRTLNSYHKTTNNEKKDLHLYDLAALFFSNSPKDKAFYEDVFSALDKYSPALDTIEALLVSIRRKKILREVSIKSYEVAEGKAQIEALAPLFAALSEEKEELKEEEEFVTTKLSTLVDRTFKAMGLRWRLNSLNQSLGSLRKGNFGFIFMRPESGKTTLLASEVSFMLEQVVSRDMGPIIWFNNEQVGDEVMLRVYQAYFGCTTEELMANIPKYEKLFLEQTKDKFLMVDRANIQKKFVEQVCKKYQPSLILFDQIDKIQGFDNDRNDLLLGSIYIWGRELAKTYGPVIGVCQADGTGENVKWLTMNHVANAKTAKQAEADWILGGGMIHDTGWESIRFFHLSKNKLHGDEDTDMHKRHGKWEVLIQPEIARYKDIQ